MTGSLYTDATRQLRRDVGVTVRVLAELQDLTISLNIQELSVYNNAGKAIGFIAPPPR